MDDVRIPRANEDSPDNDQETLQVLRPDGTLGESDEDMEARLAMESLMRHRRARRRKKLIAGFAGSSLGYENLIPVITPQTALMAAGICCGIGVLFGFYPARRAARLDPVEALRYQ